MLECNKDFEWIELTAEHIDKPGLYDVVDLQRVGNTIPKSNGGFLIVVRCEHCNNNNEFDL